MKKYLCLLLLGLNLQVLAAGESESHDGARGWLKLVDSGDYAQSWQQSADYFQKQISADKWQAVVSDVRDPLGPLVSRNLISESYRDQMPGAPDGQYKILEFESSFLKKARAQETLVMIKKDKDWRVVGYFIK